MPKNNDIQYHSQLAIRLSHLRSLSNIRVYRSVLRKSENYCENASIDLLDYGSFKGIRYWVFCVIEKMDGRMRTNSTHDGVEDRDGESGSSGEWLCHVQLSVRVIVVILVQVLCTVVVHYLRDHRHIST